MSPEPIKPMLDDYQLPLVQRLQTLEGHALAWHHLPGLNGAIFQNMGRRATVIVLAGIVDGTDSLEGLEKLREKFKNGTPVPFVADITTEARVQQVLIANLRTQELAGKPQQYSYHLILREYVPPPPPETPVDDDLFSEAGGLVDGLTDNLDAISGLEDLLGGAFDIVDPTPPLRQLLYGFNTSTSGLESIFSALSERLADG